MKRTTVVCAAALAFGLVAAFSIEAEAQLRFKTWMSESVSPTTGDVIVGGALGTASNWTEPGQQATYVGCKVVYSAYGTGTGPTYTGYCFGSVSAGGGLRSHACWTKSLPLVQLIGSTDSDSYVQFGYNALTAECKSLTIETASYHYPKYPETAP